MKILISPAKSLDFESESPIKEFSQPEFIKRSEKLMSILKKKSTNELKGLMKISDQLAALNKERNEHWSTPFDLKNAKQALFCFTGDVYKGLDAQSLNKKEIDYAQNNLRILSGLYGMLKPLDLIQPYRLEMGTKLQVSKQKKNLYQFWNESISDALNKEIKDTNDNTVINLASNEYYKAIKEKTLDARVITPIFKDFKNGQLKVIMTYAKTARGWMTRYILKHQISNPENIKKFNIEGYAYDDNLSSENEWVFTR